MIGISELIQLHSLDRCPYLNFACLPLVHVAWFSPVKTFSPTHRTCFLPSAFVRMAGPLTSPAS